MKHEIVALRCPSCAQGYSQPFREVSFGGELRCGSCGVTSVLIIDRELVPLSTLAKQGERVCTSCGRLALQPARFCQAGHKLNRECVYCAREFSVDHLICDFCGWPQDVPLHSNKGQALKFNRAVAELGNPGKETGVAILQIRDGAAAASSEDAATAASAILRLLNDPSCDLYITRHFISYGSCCAALAAIGPLAQEAVPHFRKMIEKHWPRNWSSDYSSSSWSFLQHLCAISPNDALHYYGRILAEIPKEVPYNYKHNAHEAISALIQLGPISLPVLQSFTGRSSGERGSMCTNAIWVIQQKT